MPLTAPLRGFEDMLAAERRRRVDIGILNVDDLRTIGDSAVVDALVELLRQLEDDCRLGERGVAKVDTADTVHTREDLAPRLDGLLRELSQPVSVDQRVDGWTERDKRTMYARFRELRDRLDDPMPLGPHDIPYGWAEGLINTRRRGSLTDAIVEAETWARALVDQ